MTTRPDAPHPDSILTARGIARAIRATQPPGVPGIGEHAILAELRRMGAPRIGRWYRVRWADWCSWMARRVEPAPEPTPARDDAVEWATERIAREDRGAA